MPTPQSVRDAAARADEMIRQGTGEPAPGPTPNAVSDAANNPPSADEPTSDTPQEQNASDTPDVVPSVVSEGDDQAPQAPSHVSSAELDELKKRAELWEQRYRSLNGMIESRDRQIESLHELISNMQAMQPAVPAEEESEPEPDPITKEDVESFGDDLIDLARRVARAESAEQERKMQARIQELEEQLYGVAEQSNASAQDQFLAKLRTRIANLDQINTDPKFIEWLQQSQTRQQMFNAAVSNLDVPGAAWFFETWAEQQSAKTPAPPKTDPRLERQVAPGKSRSVPSPAQNQDGQKRQWTRSEIVNFYKTIGSYPQKERDKIERDIALAQQEGRVDFTK